MMTTSERHFPVGGDPRLLSDYAALRDELGKLTHPARPDVDWRRVEQLSLSLFERNGVELQTAAWYTEARLRLLGVPGLNEGLAMLEALITRQWAALWPQPVHARTEILRHLSQRVQQALRAMSLCYADLGALYQAEQHLTQITAVLERLDLKHVSQMAALREHLHHAAVRLENDACENSAIPYAITPPEPEDELAADNAHRVCVAGPAPQPVRTKASARWQPFMAGMLTMLVAGGALLLGWHIFNPHESAQAQITASLREWPEVTTQTALAPEQAHGLMPEAVIAQTRQRIDWLARQPPARHIRYAGELARQAGALWPRNPEAQALMRQWRQQMRTAALPPRDLDGWHEGMTQLEQLAARLNALDERRGQYLTASELKTRVFTLQQAFAATPPAEERLRQMAHEHQQGAVSPALRVQTEIRLNQLLYRYVLLTSDVPDKVSP